MSSPSPSPAKPKWAFATGWILSLLPSALLLYGAYAKIAAVPQAVQGFKDAGWNVALVRPLGMTELLCTIVYLNPKTAVLGAILLTGYMGGAICHHLRLGESIVFQVIFGIVIWLGIFLREPRLWAVLPWRT